MDVFTLTGNIAIDITDYTTKINNAIDQANNLYAALQKANGFDVGTTNATTATKNVTNVGNAIQNAGVAVQTGATKASQGFTVLKGIAANIGTQVVNKAYDFGKSFLQAGFEFNATMEYYQSGFKTLLKLDEEGAKKFTNLLKQFAVDTPLALEGAMDTAISMLGAGFESDTLIENMGMLGDLALGDTEKMKGLAKALADVKTSTKLFAQDARQFTNRGIPLYDMLLDYYRKQYVVEYIDDSFYSYNIVPRSEDGELKERQEELSIMEVKNWQKEGRIPYKDVLEVLRIATSEGGQFYNAMNNAMNTEKGMAEKMKDQYEQTAGAFASGIFEIFKGDTIPRLVEIMEKLQTWAEENPELLKELAQAFADLAVNGIDFLTDSLTTLLTFWNDNKDMFNSILMALGAGMFLAGQHGAGAALFTAGGYGGVVEVKKAVDDPDTVFADEPKLAEAAKTGDTSNLTAEEKAEYDLKTSTAAQVGRGIGKYLEVAGTNTAALSGMMLPFTVSRKILETELGWAGDALNWLQSEIYPNGGSGVHTTEDGTGLGGRGGKRFGVPDGDSETDQDIDDVVPGGTSGSLGQQITALLQTISTMKSDVVAATQEGFANGVSGITITAHITTGDVKLDEGTLVGAITPQIDMKLGWNDKVNNRG